MTKNELAKKEEENTLPSLLEDSDLSFSGEGLEDFRSSDFTVPYVGIVQALSKARQKTHANYVPGAEEGMFLNSATRQLYNGEKGIVVVPFLFRHRYVAWKPKNEGIAYDMGADSRIFDSIQPGEKGKRFDSDGNEIVDTMEYFCLLVDRETGSFEPIVLPFSGTFSKKARKWNNLMRNKTEVVKGRVVSPPIFYWSYLVRTQPESNNEGEWFSHVISDFKKIPELPNAESIFQTAKSLRESVKKGEIRAAVEEREEGSEPSDPEGLPF